MSRKQARKPRAFAHTKAHEAALATLPSFYYGPSAGVFWIPNERGGWVQTNETTVNRLLRQSGHSGKVPEGSQISLCERMILAIQQRNDVAYAGPLAGYHAGMHTVCGSRVLVTESPGFIEPDSGEWPLLGRIIRGMLGDQAQYFFGWLKVALASLRSGKSQPGQALVLAGEVESGKSLLQGIITRLLGGREARPFRYMRAGSEFNAELFRAEHLVIEDEAASADLRIRRWLGAKLKELTVNNAQSCHPKGRQPVLLTPFWRVSISLNSEPESLLVLPPLDNSLADKLMLLRVQRQSMPMPTQTAEQRESFWAALTAELPAFTHWLSEWSIPTELHSPRFGILHFHHPEIVAALSLLSPEERLLALIDRVLFGGENRTTWDGTAADLEHQLRETAAGCAQEAQSLFHYPTACGVLLGKLAQNSEWRVKSRRRGDARLWRILAP